MDLQKLRNDFPLLASPSNKPVMYFDNACMSLKPRAVINAMNQYYEQFPACGGPGRSGHALGARVREAVDQSRQTIARAIGAQHPNEIIFTRNTTESINLVARSFRWNAGDVVLTTDKEHNSNLIPWLNTRRLSNIRHAVIPSLPDNTFDLSAFEQLLKLGSVRLVSVGLVSNLDGVRVPIAEIIKRAHAAGAMVMVDAAQAMLHSPLNVQALGVDFLAFSGHKMLGPTGTGVLYGKRELLENLEPFLLGGDTVSATTYTDFQLLDVPERFEAGLQDYAGIIGLGAAMEYLQSIGWPFIESQDQQMNRIITEGIAHLKGVHMIGPADPALRGGIVAFTIKGMDHHQVAVMLEQMNAILVRSGQHCVHSWFGSRGIPGSVRASVAFYNTVDEAEQFVQAMEKITTLL
ncbi:cysteine desulfurase [Candidatus Uhrbacteria bacterium]|nr:cysteine desulfurase [Candidatus Uhrbacteria bacterium]